MKSCCLLVPSMLKMSYITLLYILLPLSLVSCSDIGKVYRIGVSQCSMGCWRDKVNSEMLAAQHLYEHDINIEIINSYDDTRRQISQIDSLAGTGIDLLVVAPNESAPLAEAIARTQKKGIPVVFFDRRADTEDYTAFIGGDNVMAGKTVANYALQLCSQLSGKRPVVLEITGTMETSPAQERHKGFAEVLDRHQEIDYYSCDGYWSSDSAYQTTKKFLAEKGAADIIFCHSDFMAVGIHQAAKEAHQERNIKILGIDGMPDEGIAYVQQGLLAGSYIYPTHGEKVVRLALDILTHKPFSRNNSLLGMMVTPENADLIGLNSRELMKQNADLVTIHDKLEHYLGVTDMLHKLVFIGVFTIFLLLFGIVLTWMAVKKLRKANRQMKALSDEQTLFYTNASHQLKTPLTLIAGPVRKILEDKELTGSQKSLMEIVSRNITQLETVTSNVLKFRKGMAAVVDDDNASEVMHQVSSDEVMKESRLAILKQEDTEELPSILIVDDNDDMRAYLRTLLADKFYVQEAADGQSGLKLARDTVPDIVVSDVMMPVMNGLQFCQKLKENTVTSHIPVILLTARSTELQQLEGYEHGADAYLTKPFSATLLVARIYNLVKSRQQLRRLFDKQDNEKEEQPQLSTQDKLFSDSLREVIKKNLSNSNLKMDELGEDLGLSRVQLYRKVKALTGLSPVELLRQMRLQRGYTLLSTTTKTVSEIAYEVGFGTPGYFSKCFKEQYGKYPMELRAE